MAVCNVKDSDRKYIYDLDKEVQADSECKPGKDLHTQYLKHTINTAQSMRSRSFGVVYHPRIICGYRVDPTSTSISANCGFADPAYPTTSTHCGFVDLTHPTTSANCGADDTISTDLADAAVA